MKIVKVIAIGLVILPIGLASPLTTAQGKVHYIDTPKGLRGNYHGTLTKYKGANGQPFYGGATYRVSKKYLEYGMKNGDTYPERITKVHKYRTFEMSGISIHVYRFHVKQWAGKKYYNQYLEYHKAGGMKSITLGNSYKQVKAHINRPNPNAAYKTWTFWK